MVSIDYTLFIQIINFVVLIWALNLVLYRPIRGIINQRTEKVDGLETGIESFEQDVVDKDQAIKDGLKEARTKGVEHKEALENEAKALEKEKIEEINERSRQDLSKVREQIAKDMDSARQALEAEVDKFADDISQKILGRAV